MTAAPRRNDHERALARLQVPSTPSLGAADLNSPDAEILHDVRRHVEVEYAGVFDDDMVDRFLADYVGEEIAEEHVEEVLRHLPPGGKVLDVGSGFGSFVLAMRRHEVACVGVDIGAFEVEISRRRCREVDASTVFRSGSALQLPFDEGSFDAVTLWNVLEHVPDATVAICEAARVLRPGGRVHLVAPNYAAVRREAHYHVPWFPLLPRAVASRYLSAIGRDPTFFETSIHYVTNRGVLRSLRRVGLEVVDPRADKLLDPELVRRPAVRWAIELIRRLDLVRAARAALALRLENPFRTSIRVQALRVD